MAPHRRGGYAHGFRRGWGGGARHTFATTVALANGVPIESLSRMLGHRDIHTTQIYAKVLAQTVVDDGAELAGKIR